MKLLVAILLVLSSAQAYARRFCGRISQRSVTVDGLSRIYTFLSIPPVNGRSFDLDVRPGTLLVGSAITNFAAKNLRVCVEGEMQNRQFFVVTEIQADTRQPSGAVTLH